MTRLRISSRASDSSWGAELIVYVMAVVEAGMPDGGLVIEMSTFEVSGGTGVNEVSVAAPGSSVICAS